VAAESARGATERLTLDLFAQPQPLFSPNSTLRRRDRRPLRFLHRQFASLVQTLIQRCSREAAASAQRKELLKRVEAPLQPGRAIRGTLRFPDLAHPSPGRQPTALLARIVRSLPVPKAISPREPWRLPKTREFNSSGDSPKANVLEGGSAHGVNPNPWTLAGARAACIGCIRRGRRSLVAALDRDRPFALGVPLRRGSALTELQGVAANWAHSLTWRGGRRDKRFLLKNLDAHRPAFGRATSVPYQEAS